MSPICKIEREMLEIVQDEMVMKDRIAALLAQGPRTIPEIAEALHHSSYEVTIWLFAMRRYGDVEEIGRADVDGYFKYELKEKPANDAAVGSEER
ncbi:MAG: MarR family transcriptional regulator [Lentisphaerae bacterium]|nr:MarR family transcriptional regulator [Lentisphaerota bacterium]